MAKWHIRHSKGQRNPVCYDTGNIKKVTLDRTSSDCLFESFACDNEIYTTMFKPHATLYGGLMAYTPRNNNMERINIIDEPKELPAEFTEVKGVYSCGGSVCSDPRILYLNARAMWLYRNQYKSTDFIENKLNAMLPNLTNEKATAFLKKHGFATGFNPEFTAQLSDEQYANIERFLALKEDEL